MTIGGGWVGRSAAGREEEEEMGDGEVTTTAGDDEEEDEGGGGGGRFGGGGRRLALGYTGKKEEIMDWCLMQWQSFLSHLVRSTARSSSAALSSSTWPCDSGTRPAPWPR